MAPCPPGERQSSHEQGNTQHVSGSSKCSEGNQGWCGGVGVPFRTVRLATQPSEYGQPHQGLLQLQTPHPSWGSLHLGTKQAGLLEPWGTPGGNTGSRAPRGSPTPSSALSCFRPLLCTSVDPS